MTSVAPKRRASSSRFAWMSMTTIRDAPAMGAAHGVELDASGAEDHDGVAGANIRRVQDGASARYNAAAERRSLGERKLLGYGGELVLADEGPFGEAAQSEALEEANPIAA
jgi:hypothetical protein